MTTPLLPETAGVSTFGGNDHTDVDPVVDDASEYSSTYLDRLVTQVAMSAYTQPRAFCRVTVSGAAATRADHSAVWGDTSGVAPTVAYVGTGIFTVTWATSYDDIQATPESHSVSIRFPEVSAYNGATFVHATVSATSANVLTVRTFDAAGVAADPTEFTVSFR